MKDRSSTSHSAFYEQYLKFEKWATRRAVYFRAHGYWCEACGVRRKITLHHQDYRHLGTSRIGI